jgi:Adenylate and Guanylate cyclase catalytic domain
LGRGDQHDPTYNKFLVSQNLNQILTSTRYSGVPIDEETCAYTLNLYPSNEYKSQYVTDNAKIYPLSIFGIFVFVTIVFILYDVNVERRQKIVLTTARKSSTIVSSLYPQDVCDKMLHETVEFKKRPTVRKLSFRASLQSTEVNDFQASIATSSYPNRKSIEDLHPETTIYFADIAGFTAWSSSRNPGQVFTLLEVLYAALDTIAMQRKVFKVGTIGDCYVAATGLVCVDF